jgi:hypothetical protein
MALGLFPEETQGGATDVLFPPCRVPRPDPGSILDVSKVVSK